MIERILTEINTNSEDYELHNHLRMDIIKAQLCLKAYYQWRQADRERDANKAKSIRIKALEEEKKIDEEIYKRRKFQNAAQTRRGAIRGTMSPWTIQPKKKNEFTQSRGE